MSMNLHLSAEIEAVSKVGTHLIRETYDLYQTPTDVTRACLESADPMQAYLDWCKQWDKTENILEYEYDDWNSKNPIGSHPYNQFQVIKEGLEAWMKSHEGWTIEWFEM